jgi:lipopolysaccharide biosynthesis protein
MWLRLPRNSPPSDNHPQKDSPITSTPTTPQAIAFYLPQYHPIAENDEWWEPGFTEWTNVTRAKPLFEGHYQPHLPRDLGFYDLRLPETRQAQAELAAIHGIAGFCYYHYWFNGRRILQRPFEEVLNSGKPDFPFCLCWANENWTRAWDGLERHILLHQTYGPDDDRRHLRALAPALRDPRYIRIAGKPLLLIYRASNIPNPADTTACWREEAHRLGIGEIFLARVESCPADFGDPTPLGFDCAVEFQPEWRSLGTPLRHSRLWKWLRSMRLASQTYGEHIIYQYDNYVEKILAAKPVSYLRIPTVFPSWDNSSRRKRNATIFAGATPASYQHWLSSAIQSAPELPDAQKYVFINAWNEWAEGSHLEPCQKWGRAFLEATRAAILPGQVPSLDSTAPEQPSKTNGFPATASP